MTLIEEFMDEWNRTAKAAGWRVCLTMTVKRRAALAQRAREPFWLENWRAAMAKASKIPGLRGVNDRGWRADVEFFLRPDTVANILEGKYDRWGQASGRRVVTKEESDKWFSENRAHSAKVEAEWAADLEGMRRRLKEALSPDFLRPVSE